MTPYRLGINIMTSGSGLGGLGGASRGMLSFTNSVSSNNSHMNRFVNNMRSGSQAAAQMASAVCWFVENPPGKVTLQSSH